jgi:hypothetical protein
MSSDQIPGSASVSRAMARGAEAILVEARTETSRAAAAMHAAGQAVTLEALGAKVTETRLMSRRVTAAEIEHLNSLVPQMMRASPAAPVVKWDANLACDIPATWCDVRTSAPDGSPRGVIRLSPDGLLSSTAIALAGAAAMHYLRPRFVNMFRESPRHALRAAELACQVEEALTGEVVNTPTGDWHVTASIVLVGAEEAARSIVRDNEEVVRRLHSKLLYEDVENSVSGRVLRSCLRHVRAFDPVRDFYTYVDWMLVAQRLRALQPRTPQPRSATWARSTLWMRSATARAGQ